MPEEESAYPVIILQNSNTLTLEKQHDSVAKVQNSDSTCHQCEHMLSEVYLTSFKTNFLKNVS